MCRGSVPSVLVRRLVPRALAREEPGRRRGERPQIRQGGRQARAASQRRRDAPQSPRQRVPPFWQSDRELVGRKPLRQWLELPLGACLVGRGRRRGVRRQLRARAPRPRRGHCRVLDPREEQPHTVAPTCTLQPAVCAILPLGGEAAASSPATHVSCGAYVRARQQILARLWLAEEPFAGLHFFGVSSRRQERLHIPQRTRHAPLKSSENRASYARRGLAEQGSRQAYGAQAYSGGLQCWSQHLSVR